MSSTRPIAGFASRSTRRREARSAPSTRGALPTLPPVGFHEPPPEPGPLITHQVFPNPGAVGVGRTGRSSPVTRARPHQWRSLLRNRWAYPKPIDHLFQQLGPFDAGVSTVGGALFVQLLDASRAQRGLAVGDLPCRTHRAGTSRSLATRRGPDRVPIDRAVALLQSVHGLFERRVPGEQRVWAADPFLTEQR